MGSAKEGRELIISKIRDGIVIDHIPVGRALTILRILRLTGSEGRIALVMNVESRKLGRKDIVKIEGKELSMEELNLIALIAPTATINIIKDYEVVKKFKVELPNRIRGIVRCSNPKCISNKPREPITPSFTVVKRNPPLLKCDYCGTYMTLEDVEKSLVGRYG